MKSLVIFCLGFFLAYPLFAQEADSTKRSSSRFKTVFHKNKRENSLLSGYFTILNELSLPSANQIGLAYAVGGEAGALFNQRVYVGAYSLVSVAPQDLENSFLDNTDLKMLQIGGNIGFKIAPNNPIHLSIGSRIGYASLQWYEWDRYNTYEDYRLRQRIDGWSITPHANVELNFFSWLQAYAGVGYRMAWGGKAGNYDLHRDLRQPTFQVGVSFGYFK